MDENCLIVVGTSKVDSNGHDLCLDSPGCRLNTNGDANPIMIGDFV